MRLTSGLWATAAYVLFGATTVHCFSKSSPFVPPEVDAGATYDAATYDSGTVPSRDGAPPDAGAPDASPDATPDAGPSGVLDTTFNATGFVSKTGTAGASTNRDDFARGVAIDSMGRVVVAGGSQGGAGQGHSVAAWRLTPQGAFDPTFGTQGAWWKTGTLGGMYDDGWAVTIDSQDRPVLAGTSNNGFPISSTAWRLDTTGKLDPSFAGTGYAGMSSTTGGPQGYDLAAGVLRTPNDGVFLVGYSEHSNNAIDMVVWKYTSAGALDTAGFGAPNGFIATKQTASPMQALYWDGATSAAVDGAGRLVVAGWSMKDAASNFALTVWRFTSAGAPDTSFHGTGHFTLSNPTNLVGASTTDSATGIVVDASGRIVVAGYSFGATVWSAWALRLTAGGDPDATFGASGVVALPPATMGATATAMANAVALDSQGRIVVAGMTAAKPTGAKGSSVAAWRLTPSGAIDRTYGVNGVFSATGAAGGTGVDAGDSASGLAIDSSDRAVLAGTSLNATGEGTMTVWRLTP